MILSLDVPMPPTLSACYTNVRGVGRVKTKVYKAWQKGVVDEIGFTRRIEMITGPVRVEIAVTRPDKRRRDLDNLLKSLCDVLTAAKVIGDDSQIHRLGIAWRETGSGATIEIHHMERA